ncbi:MAG: hypothetical protein LBN10_09155 [Propionibacteriaceae bacterium]|jgi:hypothetical protein|nr:hypothetical protein [Propionibacteriaceae bacterium]
MQTQGIDRRALVARHRIDVYEPHPEHVLSVGNGDFAYTADITGMQTFTAFHTPTRTGPVAINTATMSNWGWHEMPNPDGFTLDDAMTSYKTARGTVTYPDKHDMMGAMTGNIAEEFRAGAWLNANPQRIDLGRVGLELRRTPDAQPESDPAVLSDIHQSLDLWSGLITSSFGYGGEDVRVETVASPDDSTVAFHISSRLLLDGRARVVLQFPYASDGFATTTDWGSPQRHRTELDISGKGEAIIRRTLDATKYVVHVSTSNGILRPTGQPHVIEVSGSGEELELVVRFSLDDSDMAETRFPFIAQASADSWQNFWESGAALDLSDSTDPRAHELERRVVLSQYLTRVHSSGCLPPAETGLVTNSWQGKFHLEMHLWHEAHFAVWGRPELLERSLDWYVSILDQARATATRQGYPGARWPKQTGPDGRESPSDIGTLLAWQQPHIIHLLELVWQASTPERRQRFLERFAPIVHETATFMAGFAEEREGAFHLGPPIIPAQEFYDARTTTDPTFELAYWWWCLDIAQQWRQRQGLPRQDTWQDVQDRLASPNVRDGHYTAIATGEPMRRDDHPSVLMALGVVPPGPLIDPALMEATLNDVWQAWEWETAWGWDFPVMAMTASRLQQPALALDALLRDEKRNTYTLVGHCPQMGNTLPLYLPANGGLLLAVALLAQDDASGFKVDGWHALVEGFQPFPSGAGFDENRIPQTVRENRPEARAEGSQDAPLSAVSSIGEWLEHPVGAGLLLSVLERSGATASSLAALKSLPLEKLIELSEGKLPQSLVDDLVLQANASGDLLPNNQDKTQGAM